MYVVFVRSTQKPLYYNYQCPAFSVIFWNTILNLVGALH